MQVEIFTIADAATDSNGKLNILGSFDTIFSLKTPVVPPLFAIAVKIRSMEQENQEYKLEIHIYDHEDNEVIPPFKTLFKVEFNPNRSSSSTNFIMNMQGVKFEKYGDYTVWLYIDGKKIMSLPLFISEQKP